jgi:hypothetical protein
MATWFYQIMGEEIGPVSSSQLTELADKGIVTIDTLVRKEQAGDWITADRLKGLFETRKNRIVRQHPNLGEEIRPGR